MRQFLNILAQCVRVVLELFWLNMVNLSICEWTIVRIICVMTVRSALLMIHPWQHCGPAQLAGAWFCMTPCTAEKYKQMLERKC